MCINLHDLHLSSNWLSAMPNINGDIYGEADHNLHNEKNTNSKRFHIDLWIDVGQIISLIATVDCVKDLLKILGFYDCKYVFC